MWRCSTEVPNYARPFLYHAVGCIDTPRDSCCTCGGVDMWVLPISFGRFSMYSRSDGSAAAAARGLLWPAQAPACQAGGPPPGRGLYKWATKRHAEGRPLAWSRRRPGRYLHRAFNPSAIAAALSD
jgi:hypothetical protein